MQKFFKVVWEWLDGNKTLIGTMLLVLVEKGLFGDSGILYEFVVWLAYILAGTGVAHKLIKGTSNTGK